MKLNLLIVAATALSTAATAQAREVPPQDLQSAAAGPTNQLAFTVAGPFAERPDANFVLSPLSVASALSMTLLGADGETARQMRAVLGASRMGDQIHYGFEAFRRALRSGGSPATLMMANRLFGAAGETFLPRFVQETGAAYGAPVENVDFTAQGGGPARETINRWVSDATTGRIGALLPEGAITPRTRLVLVNALTFNGTWKTGFDPDDSFPAPFHRADGSEVQATFMARTAPTRIDTVQLPKDGGSYDILHLPYTDKRFELLVALPDATTPIERVWAHLPTGYAERATKPGGKERIKVLLPRFVARFNADLAPVLGALGMPDALSAKADFSKMNGKTNLFLTAIVHESWLQIDERGTRAAAATAVVAGRKGVSRTRVFRADRPFFYVLRDVETDAIVFIGRMGDPSAAH